MNVALMGSVSSSLSTLEALIRSGVEVTGVLGVDESLAETICDYRSLRGTAAESGIPFHSFVKVSEPGVEKFLRSCAPDMLWVIGLSQLVPQHLIDLAPDGGVGFHPTMLPQGRGRAPVAWTILLGQPAAANLFFLSDEPDAGDIIAQRQVEVKADDYSEDLIHRTNRVLSDLVMELAPQIRAGKIPRRPQDHSKATYYKKRTAADGLIDWSRSTDDVFRLIRAAGRPYHGAFTHVEGRKLIVWRGHPSEAYQAMATREPGIVVHVDQDLGIQVTTGEGVIWLTEVVPVDGGRAADLLAIGARLA